MTWNQRGSIHHTVPMVSGLVFRFFLKWRAGGGKLKSCKARLSLASWDQNNLLHRTKTRLGYVHTLHMTNLIHRPYTRV